MATNSHRDLSPGPVDSASRKIRLPTLCASQGYCEDHGVTVGQVFEKVQCYINREDDPSNLTNDSES